MFNAKTEAMMRFLAVFGGPRHAAQVRESLEAGEYEDAVSNVVSFLYGLVDSHRDQLSPVLDIDFCGQTSLPGLWNHSEFEEALREERAVIAGDSDE
jgi:hypothetical protein